MMKKYIGTKKHASYKSLEDRNMVNEKLGLHILERAQGIVNSNNSKQTSIFDLGA